jgi:hypothetical protein
VPGDHQLGGQLVGRERGEPQRGRLLLVTLGPPGGELGDGRLLDPRRPPGQPPPGARQA